MYILGLSCHFHDSAACLIHDGQIIAAVQEERLTRRKHDATFPNLACDEVLRLGGISIDQIDHVVFYEKPFLKLDRIVLGHLNHWPFGFSNFFNMTSSWFQQKILIKRHIRKRLRYSGPISFCKHHESHAASAFYNSTFDEAVIVTLDGVGEWTTGAIHLGKGQHIKTHSEMQYPQSWGLFYSAFTDYLGFQINDGEYKVMGLAPYGEPVFVTKIIEYMIQISSDGSVTLNSEYFIFDVKSYMLNFAKVENLLGIARRAAYQPLTQDHMNLAASVQKILEDGVVTIVKKAMALFASKNLVMAGGVALNCRVNSLVKNLTEVESLYIFPAAGDAGGAIGAAQFFYYHILNNKRNINVRPIMPYWGPSYSNDEIESFLTRNKYPFQKFDDVELVLETAKLLMHQKIVAWFQGRMEFGPRALGHRSILADPRHFENWAAINAKIKFREDFRPVAPAVVAERVTDYFSFEGESPFMLFVARNLTKLLPAVTHKDDSSRMQTVAKEDNPLFHSLLLEFEKLSGVPVLINTSLNTAGMPIVCNIQNAFQAFAESDLDILVLGNYLLRKENFPHLQSLKL